MPKKKKKEIKPEKINELFEEIEEQFDTNFEDEDLKAIRRYIG